MNGILASIFQRFWLILGATLGGESEPRSTQKGVEKGVKKRMTTKCPKNRPLDDQQGLYQSLAGALWAPNRRWGTG